MHKRSFIACTLSLVAAASAHAIAPWSSVGEAVAIQGYDPVAYFTQGTAVRGTSQFVHDWSGMTWFFGSAEHRDAFKAEPEKFAPQFGGFCTSSVATGKHARGAGDAWVVHEGKLYLSYDNAVRERLQRDLSGTIAKAQGQWGSVRARLEGQ